MNKTGSLKNRKFTTCIEDWLKRTKRRVRLDTYEAYLSYYENHIKPFFWMYLLRDISPRLIQEYVDLKETEGQSPSSITKHLVILNGVLKEALFFREIPYNPCEGVTLSRSDHVFKGSAYEASQARRLLEIVKGDPIEPAVYLGLYLGLRRSEVVGLRWQDIDFERDTVHICNTVVRFATISELEKTKTKASRRDLYLPRSLKHYLLGLKQTGSYICQWPDGRPYQPDYISHRFKKVLERSGLPVIRFHDLRHTAGSLLINNGQSVKQVQEFLGHEKASTTLDIYTHLSNDNKRDTANVLSHILEAG